MSKLAAFFILLFTAALPAAAQISEPNAESAYTPRKGTQPNIPGTIVLELGLNSALDAPSRFDHALWGSSTINVYYQHEIRIMESKFSLHPGIGLSLERFKFRDQTVLTYAGDSVHLVLPDPAEINIKKSHFVTNYVDVPLEFRFTAKPQDPARSFKMSFGGRVGYLYDSFNKIKYREEGETIRIKEKRDFNATNIRYGVSTKIGFGNFSLFGYYNLTNLFEDGKGIPENGVVKDFPTYTIGISLSSF